MDGINATDFLGNPIAIGDEVIYFELGYRNFKIGRVTSITKKTLTIADDKKYKGQARQFHSQVIVKKSIKTEIE